MILTYATADDVLTAHFLKQWEVQDPDDPDAEPTLLTPVILKNQQPTFVEQKTDAWVRFAVLMTASAQDSFGDRGNRRFLRIGRVFVQVFVRAGTITSLLNELCSKVIEIYERVELSPVRVLQVLQQDLPDGASRTAKVTADGTWFGSMINVQFTFDEVK